MLGMHLPDFKRNRNFIKHYIVLLISAIIPVLLLIVIIYQQTTSIIQKQSRDTIINMLDKTNQSVDLVLKQINQKIIQVVDNGQLASYVLNEETDAFTRNIEIINIMRSVTSNSEYIQSIYAYSDNEKTVITSDGGIFNIDKFYDRGWLGQYYNLFHGTTSYRGIYQLDTRKAQDMWGNEYNYITLICGLPYGLERKMGGVILNINEDRFYNLIRSEENKGELFVINNEGYIIADKNKDKLFSNLKYLSNFNRLLTTDQGYFVEKAQGTWDLYTFVTSPYNGWKYIYKIPLQILYGDKNYIARIIIVVTLFYILISLIISFLISQRIYNPIASLVRFVSNSLSDQSGKQDFSVKNEYEFLGKVYSDVLGRNKGMEDMIKSMKPLLKEKLFTNIILGNMIDLKEIIDRLNLLNIDFALPNYIVFVYQIDDFNLFQEKYNEMERSIYRLKLVNMVECLILNEYNGVCFESESNKFVSVINFSDNQDLIQEQEGILELVKNIKSKVESEFPFTVTVGLGRMYRNIEKISMSYKEALSALKYKLYQGKNEIININNVRIESEELYYYYQSEKQLLILNNLKAGNYEEVETIVNEMFNEIINNRKLSYDFVQTIFTRIVNSILELIVNYGKTVKDIFGSDCDLYKELTEKETFEDIRVWLLGICKAITGVVHEINITRANKNIEKVLEYIDQNLHKDISQRDVAEYIGLSTGYISTIFKEHLGKNYIDYLNGKRVERAKQLLKETRFNIREVGFRVGFNNIQTFMRTFKKHEGVTPGQYRESI